MSFATTAAELSTTRLEAAAIVAHSSFNAFKRADVAIQDTFPLASLIAEVDRQSPNKREEEVVSNEQWIAEFDKTD
jgi:hypothetical protein